MAAADRSNGVSGVHFVQEDLPHEIGQAIASWISDVEVIVDHARLGVTVKL